MNSAYFYIHHCEQINASLFGFNASKTVFILKIFIELSARTKAKSIGELTFYMRNFERKIRQFNLSVYTYSVHEYPQPLIIKNNATNPSWDTFNPISAIMK